MTWTDSVKAYVGNGGHLLAHTIKQLIWRDALCNESGKDFVKVFGVHAFHSGGPHAAGHKLLDPLLQTSADELLT